MQKSSFGKTQDALSSTPRSLRLEESLSNGQNLEADLSLRAKTPVRSKARQSDSPESSRLETLMGAEWRPARLSARPNRSDERHSGGDPSTR